MSTAEYRVPTREESQKRLRELNLERARELLREIDPEHWLAAKAAPPRTRNSELAALLGVHVDFARNITPGVIRELLRLFRQALDPPKTKKPVVETEPKAHPRSSFWAGTGDATLPDHVRARSSRMTEDERRARREWAVRWKGKMAAARSTMSEG
jgi:hypothetical protein